MKKPVKILLTILLTIALISAFIYVFIKVYDYTSEQKRIKINYSLSENEIALINDGDIILRHGYGFVSDIISETLTEDVSHCAIIVKDDTTFSVIHSVSQSLSDFDGVQKQTLRRFINDSKQNSVIVLRYKFKENDNKSLISEKSRYYLDKRIPFDNNFDIKDSTEFFCSELLWKVFLDAYGIDIYEDKHGKDNREFLKFDVFKNPKYFDVVFSHQDK